MDGGAGIFPEGRITSDGEIGVLKKTVRLPYWSLNGEGDEKYLEQLGM